VRYTELFTDFTFCKENSNLWNQLDLTRFSRRVARDVYVCSLKDSLLFIEHVCLLPSEMTRGLVVLRHMFSVILCRPSNGCAASASHQEV